MVPPVVTDSTEMVIKWQTGSPVTAGTSPRGFFIKKSDFKSCFINYALSINVSEAYISLYMKHKNRTVRACVCASFSEFQPSDLKLYICVCKTHVAWS